MRVEAHPGERWQCFSLEGNALHSRGLRSSHHLPAATLQPRYAGDHRHGHRERVPRGQEPRGHHLQQGAPGPVQPRHQVPAQGCFPPFDKAHPVACLSLCSGVESSHAAATFNMARATDVLMFAMRRPCCHFPCKECAGSSPGHACQRSRTYSSTGDKRLQHLQTERQNFCVCCPLLQFRSLNMFIWHCACVRAPTLAKDVGCCRYQDVEKVGAITKNIRMILESNHGVDQRLPLGTCLTVCHPSACPKPCPPIQILLAQTEQPHIDRQQCMQSFTISQHCNGNRVTRAA